MARSPIDLPRMQNQPRPRVAVARAPDLVPQADEPNAKAAQAATDAAVRADRPGQAVQPGDQRGPAQPRLRVRHARPWRAETRFRRSLFLAPAAGRRHPHRSQARRRHHRRRAPARHDRGYRRHPRRDRPPVRPRHRCPGRGPDQAEEARSRLQGGEAGGESAQALACHRRRRAGAADQARRPAAQYAHARASAARGAPRDGGGDARHLCAARRPHGYAGDARGARGFVLPRAQSRRLQGHHRAARRARRAQQRLDHRDRAATRQKARRQRHRRRSRRSPQARLFDLAQDGTKGGRASSSFPIFSASASWSGPSPSAIRRSASSIPRGRSFPAASRTTSPRPSRTITARSTPP